ncbi:MAG: AAA family ATPase, partial [Prevotellaceae bacterium]|nr:AAA family ATPase [Prevotellaceae bacterium]
MEIAKSTGIPQVYREKGAVLQQIFYGAPGTGKSHAIKERTEAWEKRDRVVRTTFHPDSDYSTFVGCYKPTTEEVVRHGKDDNETTEKVISYDFVGQAFLSAYVDAWKDRTQPEFLVIEEINRGNCAQIFGDLFQLLDRGDDGYSEYAIRADKDLQKYLEAAFKEIDIADYPKVKAGTELLLPSNLRIWATMNTSDQSLFPIDSAFKRRWDWKYIPIAQGETGGVPLEWRVEAGGKLYDWWDFLTRINKIVLDTTNSADKQMGFFFCKA